MKSTTSSLSKQARLKLKMNHLRFHILLILAFTGTTLPVLAQAMPKAPERTLGQMVLTLIISALTGFMAANSRLKEFQSKTEILQILEKKRKEEKNRIQYLNPLRTSAEDLVKRLEEVKKKMTVEEQKRFVLESFKRVNKNEIAKRVEFDEWCNIEGYFAMSTLYITSVYFFRANKLRYEFPSAQLDPSQDEVLLQRLSKIRVFFGEEYGIWETIQDSIGSYIKKLDGSLMNYKEFCGLVADSNNHVWFLSLINFYASFNLKLKDEVSRLILSLEDLINFLVSTQKVKKPNATSLQCFANQLKDIIKRFKPIRQSSSPIQRSGLQKDSTLAADSGTADGVGQQQAYDQH